MRLYLVPLQRPDSTQRAFARVNDDPRVASCIVEPAQRRLRFLAPESLGEALVERIYQEGDLVWCSRHALERSPEVA
jgi:hypothetical protein